ncbi:roadblock/LC7 domain-containing protein [Vulcanisaeta distributa]|uniref:Roadblock/LC7 family protein n=1 Tax=Vulcanisaeta distributa (strain DSM 14429 / JCM 11212 / NBRC 100878 / IC-017) TaxID=572478 RepID=E1QTL8_VULDI|nr:roadblock/LC7 domain-containing protein [Vulcanisaeta distributa]ADN49733.1 Roadblock/LC7 family protein [Vulcanisaeta distributa DSM 14429]
MESSVGKEVVNALEEFMNRVFPDIVGALVVRRDGLPVAFKVSGEFNAKVVSAMVAIARSTMDRLGAELGLGESVISVSQYTRNTLLVAPLSKDLILTAIAKPEPNLGLILLEIEKLKDKLTKILVE